ncbi:lumican [Syngnathoides biaculeatus]|uniref:lumican n=1 Tax=Syngnathoides biaculeatus TaxID=300417 RepID=UPI002ADE2EE3|nr:lumican [Syngnathoides biaculeatus]
MNILKLVHTLWHAHKRPHGSCRMSSASFGNFIHIFPEHKGLHYTFQLVSMGMLCCFSVLSCVFAVASTTTLADTDYGGVPLWIDCLLGEPSVMSLRGRLDARWYRANNPQACPHQCDCPIQWPTAVYCDDRGLAGVPEPLPPSTQYLFLQSNNISSLTASFLAKITGLNWLILDHNRLKSDWLDQGILQNQTQLAYLFANHNHLSSIPNNLPSGLKQLRLAYNQISSIGSKVLKNLPNLTLLLLQGNILKTIKEGELGGLLSLNLLDLSGNSFSSVPRHLPISVQQLYLSNNSFAGIDENTFVGLLNLKYLRLSQCYLQSRKVHSQAFNLSSLVELDLSYNKFTRIPTVPITLQHLYLEANEIQEFNVTSFCREVGPLTYSRLKILRLDGNKISYRHLPSDWILCLRVIQSIYI